MNDRFRFKAYYYNDVFNEWMVYENPEFITGDGTCRVFDNGESGADEWRENVILCQCTGLKDKNGKLIYEGDIVKFKTELFGTPKQIIWYEYHYILKDTFIILCDMEIEQFGLEVIGNIYENKELLQEIEVQN